MFELVSGMPASKFVSARFRTGSRSSGSARCFNIPSKMSSLTAGSRPLV
jgi:hypothetical protein